MAKFVTVTRDDNKQPLIVNMDAVSRVEPVAATPLPPMDSNEAITEAHLPKSTIHFMHSEKGPNGQSIDAVTVLEPVEFFDAEGKHEDGKKKRSEALTKLKQDRAKARQEQHENRIKALQVQADQAKAQAEAEAKANETEASADPVTPSPFIPEQAPEGSQSRTSEKPGVVYRDDGGPLSGGRNPGPAVPPPGAPEGSQSRTSEKPDANFNRQQDTSFPPPPPPPVT